MIQKIRTSRVSKVIACYLALMIILEIVAPMQAFALTSGPTQPEFGSFTPIGTSDMVDLSSGDFNYNIPIMDVGGYPINLAYNSGVSMDQEASWVGLGWDLNVGQINRQLRGLPDDFDGDKMIYENSMKPNITVGGSFTLFGTLFGVTEEVPEAPAVPPAGGEEGGSPPTVNANIGFGVKYNNYDGMGFSLSGGLSFDIIDNVGVGVNLTSSAADGVSVSPSLSLHAKYQNNDCLNNTLTGSVGTTYNNRKGVESLNFSASRTRVDEVKGDGKTPDKWHGQSAGGSISLLPITFTPTKRVGMSSSNFMFNMNIEGEFWGIEPGMKFSGYRTEQKIADSEKYKEEKAYGFENSYHATDEDIMDFNREKDRTLSTRTTVIPIANHTYDLYSIQGQGVGGMFRPFKSQVGYVHDNTTYDDSFGGTIGVELGGGGGAHWGVDTDVTQTNSHTKTWRESNQAIGRFEKQQQNRPDYEEVFFKTIGGFHVDNEYSILKDKLGNYDAIRFAISSDQSVESKYQKTHSIGTQLPITGPIKREGRLRRGQTIQKLTVEQALKYGVATQFSPAIGGNNKYLHHTAEISVTKDGGERYVYGRAAYNTIKREVTFDVSGQMGDCGTGLVPYTPEGHNSMNNDANGDQYFNRVTTPAYAHTYLLTAVLSPDYSDLDNNGPSDNDLGSYTKFIYQNGGTSNYKWRVPYAANRANYDEGLRSSTADNKGNYLYGEKEMVYIHKIETKTHVAIFDISLRKDGYGVDGENGGGNTGTTSRMYKLNKISLYSKPEYDALHENAVPIKVAHFEYDYLLCSAPGKRVVYRMYIFVMESITFLI